jgi:BMFP domain-containing protein YqiC
VATNAQLLTKIIALEQRVKTLESRPAGIDYSAQIANLQAQIDVLKALTCPEQTRFVTIEDRVTTLEGKTASEAAAQDILEADHVPEA